MPDIKRPVKLNDDEMRLLKSCCECEPGKGVAVLRDEKRVAASLTRKGLTWTIETIFMVCIATDEGRALIEGSPHA